MAYTANICERDWKNKTIERTKLWAKKIEVKRGRVQHSVQSIAPRKRVLTNKGTMSVSFGKLKTAKKC